MKKLTLTAVSVVMAAQMFSMPVIAEEAAASGTQMNYGFSIETPNDYYGVDYLVIGDAEGKAALSAQVTMGKDEDAAAIILPDVLRADDSTLYINAGTVASAIETATGQEGIADMLPYLEITEDWVALPVPEFDKIASTEPAAALENTQDAEIPADLMMQLAPVIMEFMPTADEAGNAVISIDSAKLLSAAQKLDEVIAQSGSSMNIPDVTKMNPLNGLDIKPAIQKYIDAVAEGYAQAFPDTTAEEASAMFGEVIDSLIEQLSASMNVTVNGQTLDAEAMNSFSLYEVFSQILADSDFALNITIGAEGAVVSLTMNGEPVVLTLGADENGNFALNLGDGENVYIVGTVEQTESGMALVVADTEGNEMFSAELAMEENGGSLTVASAGTVLFSGSIEMSEDTGFTASVSSGDTSLYLNAAGNFEGNTGSGSIFATASVNGEDSSIYGYIDLSESAEEVELPQACDGLKVVSAISNMYFSSMAQAAAYEEAETE